MIILTEHFRRTVHDSKWLPFPLKIFWTKTVLFICIYTSHYLFMTSVDCINAQSSYIIIFFILITARTNHPLLQAFLSVKFCNSRMVFAPAARCETPRETHVPLWMRTPTKRKCHLESLLSFAGPRRWCHNVLWWWALTPGSSRERRTPLESGEEGDTNSFS